MDRPIGMFDSGFGGLTVARAIIDLLPAEDLVYIGDTARYPYGPRPADEVRRFARELATSLVVDHHVKAIVVACNTAAASGIDALRNELDVPIIDVVAPGAVALVEATESGRAGVIGTVGTIASGAYVHAVEHAGVLVGRDVTLTSAACPGFVEFVERGQTLGDEVTVLAERLLAPVTAADVDALLLGCTHYPFLSRVIGDVVGSHVTLVSSADETAFSAARLLGELGLLRPHHGAPGRHLFLSSGDVQLFRDLGRRLLGPELDAAGSWPATSAPVPPSLQPLVESEGGTR
ncbi:MAG TPA: glutamate racemase [Desertimonas sp.]|nr:glutamate racemase [Desertimonas sp.]